MLEGNAEEQDRLVGFDLHNIQPALSIQPLLEVPGLRPLLWVLVGLLVTVGIHHRIMQIKNQYRDNQDLYPNN